MKKITNSLLLAVIVAAMVVTGQFLTVKTFAQGVERANGRAITLDTSEDGTQWHRVFSFNARRNPHGEVNGRAMLTNPAFTGDDGQPYFLVLEITCLKIVGNVAIFGGLTRRTNDSNLVDAAYFSVEDNGEPGAGVDRISRVFFFDDDPHTQGDPQLCQQVAPTDFPLQTIDAGNVQVVSNE